MRGDRPGGRGRHVYAGRFTPACAGIDPFSALAFSCFCGLPRMRGDRPDRVYPLNGSY